MRRNPYLYEVNARLLLRRMSGKYRRNLTLAAIPGEEWQELGRRGFDLVWCMGVWQRSPGARQKALLEPGLREEYDRTLPGWTEADVIGSPYAVYAYRLDSSLGEAGELAQLKSILNHHGLGLILDFVPNHLAFDHPWTLSHPEWFVQGRDTDVHNHPDWFFSPGKDIHLAHGKDPNFPPWTDTVQLNFYSTGLRQSIINELLQIAEVADGVRCDMAMLALNSVFEKVWGEFLTGYPRPAAEFWAEAITEVKRQRPGFLFLAEAYWGLEPKLQELGFDFTYDKCFYDRLRFSTADDIRNCLMADESRQQRSVRFIENHDEERCLTAFGPERSLAAALVLATVPGVRLFHDGQLEGKRIRLPVQLLREPEETADPQIARFYDRLLTACNTPALHDGKWSLLETGQIWEGSEARHQLLAWSWRYDKQFKLAVVNYSPEPVQGVLRPPFLSEEGVALFRDELAASASESPGAASNHGIHLELRPYQAHLLSFQ